jgi:hypothetical protein
MRCDVKRKKSRRCDGYLPGRSKATEKVGDETHDNEMKQTLLESRDYLDPLIFFKSHNTNPDVIHTHNKFSKMRVSFLS